MKTAIFLGMAGTLAAATITSSSPDANTYRVTDKQTLNISTKVRHDTWIILPASEVITEAGAGDPENWAIKTGDRPTNILHLKPAIKGSTSNVHLRGSSGHIYSFTLAEISKCAKCQPDLKVFVEPIEPMPTMSIAPVDDRDQKIKDLAARATDALSKLQLSQETVSKVKRDSVDTIAREISAFKAGYPVSLRCDYDYRFNRAPFFGQAICSDEAHTYIKVGGEEMPSLYVERDGKPALVQFSYRDGTIITENVVHAGYLQLGHKKLKFRQKG